jgi:hypothetical protein
MGNLRETKEVTVADTQEMNAEQQEKKDEQMCCEGGMTAAEHRAQSPDGKCCTDE